MRALVNPVEPRISGRCIRHGQVALTAGHAADSNITMILACPLAKRVRTALPRRPQNRGRSAAAKLLEGLCGLFIAGIDDLNYALARLAEIWEDLGTSSRTRDVNCQVSLPIQPVDPR